MFSSEFLTGGGSNPGDGMVEMKNTMDYKVNKVQMDGEFKICPSCGYEDGFHSMFKKDKDVTRWFFICPSCHSVFDIGLTAGPFTDK